MIYHPTAIILLFVSALLVFYKRKRLFVLLSLLMPIVAAIFFYQMPYKVSYNLYDIDITYGLSDLNKLIGTAFFIILFAANLYSAGLKKKKEIILGSSYCAFSFLCLLCADFFSMFVALELMLVISSSLIFIGGIRSSLRSSKKYFLTHLMSSNMIIIGISHLVIKNGSFDFVNVADLLGDPEYSSVIIHIMLFGMLINIASFPFSGWMVNYYPKASPAGFLYLISFTTKVSIVLLMKLFAGYELLKYIAIIMMIYASIKAVFEDNLLSILCYLSISSMGLMLLGISLGTESVIILTSIYLFVHILYKGLMSLSFVGVINKTGSYDCSNLKKIKPVQALIGCSVGIFAMVNFPMTSSYILKSSISENFKDSWVYFVILFAGFMSVAALPWREYFKEKTYFDFEMNLYTKFALIIMSFVLLIILFGLNYFSIIPYIKSTDKMFVFNLSSIYQIGIILSGIIFSILWKRKRFITKAINLTEAIGNILFNFYYRISKQREDSIESKEYYSIASLERQIRLKLVLLHNQQSAIFIVMIITVIVLMTVLTNI